jgi:hypothetical protein
MTVAIFIAVGVVVVLMLLIGGWAERFNMRLLTRPWQPRYRDDSKPRDDDSKPRE